MLKRLGLFLLIGFFLSLAVRVFRQDTAQEEDGERSGPIAQLQRMFSGNEEESDRSDVDESGIARDDTNFAPAGGATDPNSVDDSGIARDDTSLAPAGRATDPANADDPDNFEESDTGGTGATAEGDRPRRQRPNRAENDDANLMW